VNDHRFGHVTVIFVVGCPRSGTSLVGELIAGHTAVFNGEESLFLYLMSNWSAMLKPPVAPLTERFLMAASALMKETILKATQEAGKWVFVDHSPWHALCLAEVYRLFPEARVVHVVRHAAEVANSLARSYGAGYRWAGTSAVDRVALWCQFVSAADRYRTHPGFIELRYEDLCQSPVEKTQWLLHALGLSWQDDVLQAFSRLHAGATSNRPPLALLSDAGLFFREPEPIAHAQFDLDITRAIDDLARPLLVAHDYE
jgi:hypothetical protein